MITAAIHQPNFLPWIGYFYKMLKCDRFILLDDVQFVRRSYTNRVNIRTPAGKQWITIPVKQKGRYLQLVKDVELETSLQWQKKVLGTLQSAYGRAPFFKTYFPALSAIVQENCSFLAEMNTRLIQWVAGILELSTPILKSSELPGVSGASTERLVNICRAVGADRYLSGFGGQKYQEEVIFNQHQVELVVYDFKHPVYPQLWGEFLSGMSALDLVFNCGPESAIILREQE